MMYDFGEVCLCIGDFDGSIYFNGNMQGNFLAGTFLLVLSA